MTDTRSIPEILASMSATIDRMADIERKEAEAIEIFFNRPQHLTNQLAEIADLEERYLDPPNTGADWGDEQVDYADLYDAA